MKKKKNIKSQSQIANDSLRRDWGEIRPVTRIIPNKKKSRKDKYKENYRREEW